MLLLGFALFFTLVNAAAYQKFPLDENNAVVYQFYTADGWEHDPTLNNDARAKTMMQHMNPNGIFTAVVIPKSRMSIVGPSQGTQDPDEYARDNPAFETPYLIMNGGFFVVSKSHDYFHVLPNGQPGKALPPGTYEGWPVGPTSTTPNSFKIPSLYKDQYEMLKSDDGKSFLTTGPTLRTKAVGINKMGALINLFLQSYLHKDLSDATVAINLDGGKSVILAYQEPGQPLRIIAQGYRKDKQIPGLTPYIPGSSRKFPSMVKIELFGRASPLGKVMRRSGLPLNPAKHCGQTKRPRWLRCQ
uniref:Phosphodiester glycosidase domain-containing protein n=1 Tax=Pyricularia oryzae (strain P131) TaxID=1143193 RepID=L7JR91_PYRO1